MNDPGWRACVALFGWIAALAPVKLGADPIPADATAKQIIEQVVTGRRTRGFKVRARLITDTGEGTEAVTRQILIKGRRDGGTTHLLYQAYWPDQWKGRAVVVKTEGGRIVGGYFFTPPSEMRPLDLEKFGEKLFGSDLTVEDAAEGFWDWPDQRIIERTRAGERPCVVVESRPPAGFAGECGQVRTWIDEEMGVPLVIDKFDRAGRPLKRITCGELVKRAGEWAPSELKIEPAAGGARTILSPHRGERDIEIPSAEFEVESVRAAFSAK